MSIKCIIITNKNSWVSEPVIKELHESTDISIQRVVFLDLKGNWKLIKKRLRQYGARKFMHKVFMIFQNKVAHWISFNKEKNLFFKRSFQTVINNKINYKITNNLNSSETISEINVLNPDIVFVFSCSQILSKTFLSNRNIKYINLHDSLLPSHKGPSPSFWVLFNKEKVSGYTIHTIKPKIDSGDILYREKIDVGNIGSEEELIKKIAKKAAGSIVENLIKIQNNVKIDYEEIELKESYEGIPTYNQRKILSKILKSDTK